MRAAPREANPLSLGLSPGLGLSLGLRLRLSLRLRLRLSLSLTRWNMLTQKLTVSRKQGVVQCLADGTATLTSEGKGPTLWREHAAMSNTRSALASNTPSPRTKGWSRQGSGHRASAGMNRTEQPSSPVRSARGCLGAEQPSPLRSARGCSGAAPKSAPRRGQPRPTSQSANRPLGPRWPWPTYGPPSRAGLDLHRLGGPWCALQRGGAVYLSEGDQV